MGKLGGDPYLVAHIVPLEDLSDKSLAPTVNIGCIKVVNTQLDGAHYLPFGLFKVQLSALTCKAHTTEPEQRNVISFSIFPVLHILSPLVLTALWCQSRFRSLLSFCG